jgi:NAD(P)-dependent dehydrogenase (short-subunit alcohol dehydrogenase family)
MTQQPVVIITGASGGIGQALVETFSNAGYAVIATDITAPPSGSAHTHFVEADLQQTVADQAYADAVFAEIHRCIEGRPLKALINNAAVQVLGKVEDLSREDWRRTLDINLLAPFLWTQGFLKALEAAKGCVINISSIHARLTKRGFAAYATSKAALSGLTRSLAIELGNRVRVNGIEPAAIRTAMLEAGFDGDAQGLSRLEQFHPSKCLGTVAGVGQLALWLVKTDTPFLNGTIVPFNGGIGSCLHDPAE